MKPLYSGHPVKWATRLTGHLYKERIFRNRNSLKVTPCIVGNPVFCIVDTMHSPNKKNVCISLPLMWAHYVNIQKCGTVYMDLSPPTPHPPNRKGEKIKRRKKGRKSA